jgi:hypothetical protein
MALYIFSHDIAEDEKAGRLEAELANMQGQPLVKRTWLIETDRTPAELSRIAIERAGAGEHFVFIQIQKSALWGAQGMKLAGPPGTDQHTGLAGNVCATTLPQPHPCL